MINDGLQKSAFDVDSFLLIGQSNMAGRRELGMPNLPFIVGEISEEIDEARWKISRENAKKFNENLRSIALKIGNFAVVSSKGLTMKPDGIHFDTPALRIFGERYLAEYEKMTKEAQYSS